MAGTMVRFFAVVAILNGMALVLFVLLLTLGSAWTDLGVRMNFVQLDRANVINVKALGQFHASYGFSGENLEYRNSVPRYIAGPALSAAQTNAGLGSVVAACNALASGAGWVWCRRLRRSDVAKNAGR